MTHSIEEAVYLSDRIVMLSAGRAVSRHIRAGDRPSAEPHDIRRDPRYLDMVEKIWQMLRDYVE